MKHAHEVGAVSFCIITAVLLDAFFDNAEIETIEKACRIADATTPPPGVAEEMLADIRLHLERWNYTYVLLPRYPTLVEHMRYEINAVAREIEPVVCCD